MYFKIIPAETKVPFTKYRMAALALSAVLIVGSIAALFTMGLNFGVDFKGGITIEVADTDPIDVAEVRNTMEGLGLGDIRVQEIQDFAGSDPAVVVFIEQQPIGAGATLEDGAAPDDGVITDAARAAEQAQGDASAAAQAALRDLLGDDVSFRKIDVVGPAVSGELVQKGIRGVVLAIIMMLAYIWFRFEWQFSVGAIVALVHDVIITLGMFAVTRLEFNLSIIAAILTIVGYSMNDTVVVYDRVRENLRKYKRKDLAELLDLSINETLSRTVMTSVTTLLALGSLYVFGGEVLRGFTFAMIWGIVIGT
ncbi:MAG: protein translocase subunit SecF [Pseudomonadota bacterium]